jgi:plastocyanin
MTIIRRRSLPAAVLVLVVAGAVSLAAACGDAATQDPTPVQTYKITPAAGAATTAPPTAEATEAPATTPEPTSDGGGDGGGVTEFEIDGINNEFDIEELEAPAGRIVITFNNRDGGVPHNIHFFEGDDADGESVGETDLEPGPIVQTLEMDLEPGQYFYQCDVHPTTMTGTLVVTG